MNTKRRIAASMLAFVMLFSTAFIPASAAKVTVKKVSVASSLSGNKKTVVVAKGKSVKLTTTVTVTPNKKANKKVSYSVSDKSIATVDSKGVVKGKKAGTTKVTVTSSKNKKKKATITVKVVGGAVTSVKLNKKSASLNVGQTLKLKTTVKAGKGANKTIAYTSSKAKVAKVSNKGVITAVGSGSATITAKAIDGSGKKATCKVKVANPINMAGMNIPNERTVSFTLDKACALNPAQVSVMKKMFVSGNYNNKLIIDNMTTADNVNYTVVLADDTDISVGDFVQVAVPSLTGTVKSMEMEYKEAACAFTRETVSSWTVGEYDTRTYSFSEGYGYSEIGLNGLPAGLSYKVKNGVVTIKGTPTAAGRFDYVLSATDEIGNTLSRTIHFIIGSDTTVVGAANAQYELIGTEGITANVTLYATGGSGSYDYSIVADPQATGADIYKYSSGEKVRIKAAVAGTYTVTVRATDSADASRFCDFNVVLNAKQGITVGGCLKDAQGNPMNDGDIYFTNKDRGSLYCSYDSTYVSSSTSTYSAILEPGVYDIEASYTGGVIEESKSTTYLYSQSLAASQTGYDIQLKDLYKVVLVNAADNTVSLNQDWYTNHEKAGYGSALYLKPGAYALESSEITTSGGTETGDWWDGKTINYTPYKLAASFTVVNTAVQAAVSKVETGNANVTTTPGAKNTTLVAELNESATLKSPYYAYKFTPAETGKYELNSWTVSFYNAATGDEIPSVNDEYELTAGTTYIVSGGDETVTRTFKITKVEASTSAE